MAFLIVATVSTLSVQMLRSVVIQQRDADERTVAMREVSNQMERIMARKWNELAPGSVAGEVPSRLASQFPGAQLAIEVAAEATAHRITITFDWQGRAGQRVRPVRLVAWRAAPEEPAS